MTMHPHDPSQPDPMAERRAGSTGHYANVAERLAATPPAPTNATTVTPLDQLGPSSPYADDALGVRITVDDGRGTYVDLRVEEAGRLVLAPGDSVSSFAVVLPLFAVDVLADTLRTLTGRDTAAPITGHR